MSPRSPIFKTILWKAFSAGAFVGVTIHAGRHPRGYAPARFYFRTELNQLKFAAKLEEFGPIFARDHRLDTAIGAKSGLLYFVELPLSSIRPLSARQPLQLEILGGVRGLKPVYHQLISL